MTQVGLSIDTIQCDTNTVYEHRTACELTQSRSVGLQSSSLVHSKFVHNLFVRQPLFRQALFR